jgi:hypothetical protein
VRREKSEARIQREILLALGAEPDFYLDTNPVGRATYMSQDGKPYTVPYGFGGVGAPDLVGFLEVPGRDCAAVVGLEVKRPGENPRPEQEQTHARWRRRKALVYVVRSVEDARAALADARKRVQG